jgi:GNAT superfamily N-acetyltransferase
MFSGSSASASQCILGVASSEPISGAVRRSDSDLDTVAPVPAACVGIRQIWTHPQARRRGVGRLLVQGAQAAGVCGAVPLEAVAFSSPTIAGAALARAVCGRVDIAVYG